MTYRELIEDLKKLTKEQLDCTVTVEDINYGEYYAGDFDILVESDVLDEDHPIITFSR